MELIDQGKGSFKDLTNFNVVILELVQLEYTDGNKWCWIIPYPMMVVPGSIPNMILSSFNGICFSDYRSPFTDHG